MQGWCAANFRDFDSPRTILAPARFDGLQTLTLCYFVERRVGNGLRIVEELESEVFNAATRRSSLKLIEARVLSNERCGTGE
jgi:hypothetical protein